VAAKLALGHSLADIENRLTRVTKSCFEPALDYCVVKVPRWDLAKFKNVDLRIGSEMKSVGEVMSIGRTFEEALQKALRMTGIGAPGLAAGDIFCGGGEGNLRDALTKPTDRRIFIIYRALSEGWPVERIHRLTKIDRWFLHRIAHVLETEEALKKAGTGGTASPVPVSPSLLSRAKRLGFSDSRIGEFLGMDEAAARSLREEYRIRPAVKQIDTLAAEYPAKTNYLYMTYGAAEFGSGGGARDDVSPAGRGPTGSGAAWNSTGAASTPRRPPGSSAVIPSW
jgi:carbamoyl-phosphate synthase large subunit